MGQHLKIIPLLIVVAMLSFSVRLIEVVSGFSDLSTAGVAYAETQDNKEDRKPSATSDKANHAEGESDKQDMASKTTSEDSPKPDVAAPELDTSKWRDPSDEAPAYEAVKREVSGDLVARRNALQEREKSLNTREALLKAAEKELGQKYKELSQLRDEIENLLGKQSEEERSRIASLVKIYEGMKPKDAARIFDTLDLDILVSVVEGMSERKLSPVLAAMDPERARTVTIMLAEQKKLPSLP